MQLLREKVRRSVMKLAGGIVNGSPLFSYGERQVGVVVRVLGIVERIEEIFNIEGDDGYGLSEGR